jgi:sortase A
MLTLAIEIAEYPWRPTPEQTELPDPPLPAFDVYSYAEYIEMMRAENYAADSAISAEGLDALPGGWVDDNDESYYDNSIGNSADTDGGSAMPVRQAPRFVLLGSVKIPRINISENLFLGTGSQLNHGIGHLAGTPLPGEEGNSVIAAHRSSAIGMHPFRHANLLHSGNTVIITLGDEVFIYEVFDSFIVSETDLWVLQAIEGETHSLTLVTCDPVGAARAVNRLIIRARLTEQ